MTAIYALIPAAGRGARFSSGGENKVFTPLRGTPLLGWTVAAFAEHPQVDGIVVVTGAEDIARCRAILSGTARVMAIVAGGRTRQESVQIGLYALGAASDDIILVHDGARPLISKDVIDRCIDGVRESGSAVAAVPVSDTLKRVESGQVVSQTVNRESLWAVQTPQAFRCRTLVKAFSAARDEDFIGTDEASLVERLPDEVVHLVRGAAQNIKVTRPEDLTIAEAILAHREMDCVSQVRIGFGYDIHRLVTGRRLVLGGVEIPHTHGLDGHSDADVLLHAICDALLGAAALPDIGVLFPNTDPAYSGIDSAKLLEAVALRLSDLGFRVGNIDATVIAEAPKIAPHVEEMQRRISSILGLEPALVGIKATTHEGLGALGRGEGIAAHAVATLLTSQPQSHQIQQHSPPMKAALKGRS